tara:strand:- start:14586 stop:14705 length:120 start_codon:yes stop_codon:yes gene_type:complete
VSVKGAVSEYREEYDEEGIEIDLEKLPPGVNLIRVYCSY